MAFVWNSDTVKKEEDKEEEEVVVVVLEMSASAN